MATIFSYRPGVVVMMDEPGLAGRSQLVKVDPALTFQEHLSIITRITLSQQANVQFLHTLGGDIYIYAFGDRIGQVTLHGVSFDAKCDDQGIDVTGRGIEKILSYYQENRATARQQPLKITLGVGTAFEAFLVSVAADSLEPGNRLFAYQLQLATIPDRIPRRQAAPRPLPPPNNPMSPLPADAGPKPSRVPPSELLPDPLSFGLTL